MGARVVSFASAKGGSGKTMLTATFATFMAALDLRVLMIDTDAATNGLSLLYLDDVVKTMEGGNDQTRGLFELRGSEDKPTNVSLGANLDLLPATYGFRNSESAPVRQYTESLAAVVRNARKEYDVIFLDAQAGSDEYAQISVDASLSDQVVIVSEYDPMSAAGVERLKALFGERLAFHRTWVLLNKMLPDFVQSFSDFLEIARYASPIPWDSDVVRAYARRSLALDLNRGNDHTLAVIQAMRSLFGDLVDEPLERWLEVRASAIREPAKLQLEDVRRRLSEIVISEEYVSQRIRQRGLIRQLVISAALVLGIIGSIIASLPAARSTLSTVAVAATVTALFAITIVSWSSNQWKSASERELEGERTSLIEQARDLRNHILSLEQLEKLDAEAVIRRARSL